MKRKHKRPGIISNRQKQSNAKTSHLILVIPEVMKHFLEVHISTLNERMQVCVDFSKTNERMITVNLPLEELSKDCEERGVNTEAYRKGMGVDVGYLDQYEVKDER